MPVELSPMHTFSWMIFSPQVKRNCCPGCERAGYSYGDSRSHQLQRQEADDQVLLGSVSEDGVPVLLLTPMGLRTGPHMDPVRAYGRCYLSIKPHVY